MKDKECNCCEDAKFGVALLTQSLVYFVVK